jgi:hypothetical protein
MERLATRGSRYEVGALFLRLCLPMFSMQTLSAISRPSRNGCSGALGATAKPEWRNLVVCKMSVALWAT